MTLEPIIIIVTRIDDPHTDHVLQRLVDHGHEVVRLNTDDIPTNVTVSLMVDGEDHSIGNSGINILTNGRYIDGDRVGSIWWRRPGPYRLPNDFTVQEQAFALGEIEQAIYGFCFSLDCFWVNHPMQVRKASWKYEQLVTANALGFKVPRTLITQSPERAREFFEICNGNMIFKVLSDPFLGAPKVVDRFQDSVPVENYKTLTTKMSQHDLVHLDSITLVPSMFQEYVPKQYEVRAIVVGDEIFAAAIHSQENEGTKIDWRNYDTDIDYTAIELPWDISQKCIDFVQQYGLNFSAFDFIVEPDGNWVFLENNPNGQFLFVEQRVPTLQITDALCGLLASQAH